MSQHQIATRSGWNIFCTLSKKAPIAYHDQLFHFYLLTFFFFNHLNIAQVHFLHLFTFAPFLGQFWPHKNVNGKHQQKFQRVFSWHLMSMKKPSLKRGGFLHLLLLSVGWSLNLCKQNVGVRSIPMFPPCFSPSCLWFPLCEWILSIWFNNIKLKLPWLQLPSGRHCQNAPLQGPYIPVKALKSSKVQNLRVAALDLYLVKKCNRSALKYPRILCPTSRPRCFSSP